MPNRPTSTPKKLMAEFSLEKERPRPLYRNLRFCAPVRAARRFEELKKLLGQETVWGKSTVREWKKGRMMRLYYPDNSYIFVDASGAVRSSGGAATRAKFAHALK
jgi:hypothetical protein